MFTVFNLSNKHPLTDTWQFIVKYKSYASIYFCFQRQTKTSRSKLGFLVERYFHFSSLFVSQLLYLMLSILADQTPHLQTAQSASDHFTFWKINQSQQMKQLQRCKYNHNNTHCLQSLRLPLESQHSSNRQIIPVFTPVRNQREIRGFYQEFALKKVAAV